MKKILVVNVNWLGDVIFSSPIFPALRRAYPDSTICCMAVPRVREILESVKEIDEIIEFDETGTQKGLFSKLKLTGYLKKQKFDAAFLLSRSFSRASMLALAKIPVRVGYDHKNRGKLLTHITEPNDQDIHRSDYYLRVIKSYGIQVEEPSTVLEVDPKDTATIKSLLNEHGITKDHFVIALNPGGNWDLKRWPKQNFTKLINLLGPLANSKILLTGSAKDKDLVDAICSACSNVNPTIVMTGRLSLKELMALMKEANVLVTADSGPLHIASSVGCPTVSVFGPTRSEVTGPRGENRNIFLQKDIGCNRQACYHLDCQDNICMQAVTVEEVYESIKTIQNS